jgi:hypothetical protein
VQLRRFAKAKGKSVLARYPRALEAVKALRSRLR